MNKEGEKGECSAFEATGGRFFCLILARDLESFFCCVPTYLPTRGDSNAQGKSLRGEWTMQSGDSKEFGICPTGPKGAWHLTLPYLTYVCSTPTVPYCNTGGSGVSVQLEILFFIGRLIPCVSHY